MRAHSPWLRRFRWTSWPSAAWNASSSSACRADNSGVDERTLEAVISALDDPERFNQLLQAVQAASDSGASIGARAAALLGLIRKAIDRLRERDRLDEAAVLQTVADSAPHMTADMMLSLLREAREQTETGEPPLAAKVIARMGDGAVANFVAGSIVAELAPPNGSRSRSGRSFQRMTGSTACSNSPRRPRRSRLLAAMPASKTSGRTPPTC